MVLTPGVFNGAYFEHALLARTMGVELVEGRDLECRRGRVMMRTTNGLEPVHVIYRRVDDEFLDPVHFRGDSLLGCSGLVNAARAGNVTIANAIGNGVADDKLVYTYLPELIRFYLGEEPILRNVDTWRLDDPESREEVLDRLDELVLKPVDGSGGKGIVIGPRATPLELDELRAKVLERPARLDRPARGAAVHGPDVHRRQPQARHVDLRPFAVNDGNRVWVLPGGLTRVAHGRGRADRELLPRRRLQGHLGPRRHRAASPSRRAARTGHLPLVAAERRPGAGVVLIPAGPAATAGAASAGRRGGPGC